ncbi:aminocarboxymuconate-semialdehyde decarboxylase [Halarchaeum rubridurum]|uniref:4-oxalomesaconate hydratase n=1 Tax=Halarchaeum rubridurum TaxID=489911 RepID=A0A830FUP3_9EURY|nr:amidohydrolase family protein [Halarchaeum rubridurum]MBP1954686.1 aminocarboxymuconate-semialdehyde decarboxylase [Halarchaeum rubridurum]GGM63048.1 4-oxalomesaconate hydratase [Halarchaeum rubridurum]
MPPVIDAYSHVLPPAVYDKLVEVHPHDEVTNLETATHLMDVDNRIADMEEFGIDKQVLTLAHPPIWEGLSDKDALEVTRLANDEIRRIADDHPDKFIPVATLPRLTGEFVDEVGRAVDDLDMAGVQTFTNVEGRLLDDPEFAEFYDALNQADVPLWIHPQLYDWHDYEAEDTWIYKALGWPFDTTVALARLVFNGVLDEFPNIDVVSHHMGGFLPFVDERIRSFYQSRSEDPELYVGTVSDLSQPLDAYFDRIYADTAVSSRGKQLTLQCGYEFFGADNVLFGADYPFGPDGGRFWLDETVPAVEAMDVPESDREAILGGNLLDLLDR